MTLHNRNEKRTWFPGGCKGGRILAMAKTTPKRRRRQTGLHASAPYKNHASLAKRLASASSSTPTLPSRVSPFWFACQ